MTGGNDKGAAPAAPGPARVRELLLGVWGQQSCQIDPGDWPRVLAAMLCDAPSSRGASQNNHGRASLQPLLDAAVAALTEAFNASTPPADPVMTVWRAFPRLDLPHRRQLAELLLQERTHVEA